MQLFERNYKQLIKETLSGSVREGRNGTTVAQFGTQIKFDDLRYDCFPLITCRKMFPAGVIGELAAFLQGPKSVQDFEKFGCNYWKLWAKEDGALNVDYGNKWRDFNGVDQIARLIDGINKDPYGRRHIINAWDPSSLDDLSLPCCHYCYQFCIDQDGCVNLIWIQRSADLMIGVPSDAVLAALLTILVANSTGYKPGTITMQFGDTHIYSSHLKNVNRYISRKELPMPSYKIDSKASLTNFEPSMFEIINYQFHAAIKFEVIA